MWVQQSVFNQRYIPGTSYYARNNWLQYGVNLVTIVPADFKQKPISPTSIVLTLKLFSGSVLARGMPNGAPPVFFIYSCPINMLDHGNPIESNMCKYQLYESNDNSNNCNI